MSKYIDIIKKEIAEHKYPVSNTRKLLEEVHDLEDKHAVATEIKCFNLMLRDGDLKPVFEVGNYCETDLSKITSEEEDYIKSRIKIEKSPFFLTRYAHILYLRIKHNDYAKIAIDGYKIIIEEHLLLLKKGESNVIELFENIDAYHHLSARSKNNIPHVKNDIVRWFELTGYELFYYQQFYELFASSILFKRKDIISYTDKALSLYDNSKSKFEADYYLEACLKLATKEGKDLAPIYIKMAESELSFSERRNDDSGMITAGCYLKAALYYKKANQNKKSNEILRKLEKHKKNIKLGVVSSQSRGKEVQEHFNQLKKFAASIVSRTDYPLFILLSFHSKIIIQSSERLDNENSFLDHVTTYSYDININTKILSDYEKRMSKVFISVKMHYQLVTLPLLKYIQLEMKENNRNFVEEGLEYFKASWFGFELEQAILSAEPRLYSWFPYLEPALTIMLEISQEKEDVKLTPMQQMAFDQLSVKFEGIFRDICQLKDLTVTKIQEDKIVAMDINEMLHNDELSEFFEKEDIDLWRFFLTGSGYNIRNNVAHGFLKPDDYTINKAQLLLVAYIRIAKYTKLIMDNFE